MNVYNLRLTITFLKDEKYEEVNEIISNFISSSMLLDSQLKILHKENKYKFYIFSMPFPIEKDHIYKKNSVYVIDIRSFKEDLILKLKFLLPRVSGEVKIIASELRILKQRPVTKLISLTPAISTINNKCWTKEDGLELIMNKIHSNAVKKTKALIGQDFSEPTENFIECIEQLNFKPIKMKYKNTSLLGNKFELAVKSDSDSQTLAWTIFGMGLLEKGSQGYGYCIAK